MRLGLDQFASGLALVACICAFALPGSSLPLWLSLGSLPLAAWGIMQRPYRLYYLLGFGFLGLVVILLEWPFPPQTGQLWIPLTVLSFQVRLALIALAEQRRDANKEFAAELSAAIPEKSLLFIDNDIETITPTKDLHRDHVVRVQPGEPLPADGIVSFGSGFAEELMLTGEPEPAAKGIGKFVFAGSKSKNSTFLFRVLHAGKATFLEKKAEFLRKGFRGYSLFSTRYILLEVVALFALICLHASIEDSSTVLLGVWLSSLGSIYGGAAWALQLAMSKRSAAMGVVWQTVSDISAIGSADTLVTDPEGSLMEGSLRLSGVATEEAMAEEGALRLAAPLARKIESPAAFSLLKELRMRNIPLELLDAYNDSPGGGIGVVGGEEVRLCDEATIIIEQVPFAKFSSFLTQEMNRAGASALFLLKGKAVIAVFTFVDTVRSSSAPAVSALGRSGISLILISPARKESVEALAEEVGVTHFHGEARPSSVDDLLTKLKRSGLTPVWLDNGIVPMPASKIPKIATAITVQKGEAITARWDLASAWQLIRLARSFLSYAREQFLLAVFLQLLFLGISLQWPALGAAAAILVAAPLLFLPPGKLAAEPLR